MFQLFLLSLLNVFTVLLGVAVNGTNKVSWPALQIESEEFFNPLMGSFSKFPFHDIYEAPASPMETLLAAGHRLANVKPLREWSRQIPHEPSGAEKIQLCKFLAGILEARGEQGAAARMRLPAKLRKLAKYCKS